MNEKPILFSAPLVRAILEGRKTQTRRIVNPQPPADAVMLEVHPYDYGAPRIAGMLAWFIPEGGDLWPCGHDRAIPAKYGVPGDRLWVRETFAVEHSCDENSPPHDDGRPTRHGGDEFYWGPTWEQPHYRATDPVPDLVVVDKNGEEQPGCRWRPSIFMPRWASRIDLEVTGVRVERLRDISEEDARAEGCTGRDPEPADEGGTIYSSPGRSSAPCPRSHFVHLWDEINGKREGCSWHDNPWVWVIEFRRVRP